LRACRYGAACLPLLRAESSWVGQYEAGDSNYRRSQANATAILFVDGEHDSDLENVIVFSGKVGVNSTNGANRIQGVHTWNL
jgi:hypothetical protein